MLKKAQSQEIRNEANRQHRHRPQWPLRPGPLLLALQAAESHAYYLQAASEKVLLAAKTACLPGTAIHVRETERRPETPPNATRPPIESK